MSNDCTDGGLEGGKSYVLVVDDDEDICEVVVLLLRMHDLPGIAAHDGLEAMEAIRRHGRPRLILLDLRMPRLNGPDFVRLLRRDPTLASVPVVVLSGDVTARDSVAQLGAQAYLTKPIELRDLYRVVGLEPGGAGVHTET